MNGPKIQNIQIPVFLWFRPSAFVFFGPLLFFLRQRGEGIEGKEVRAAMHARARARARASTCARVACIRMRTLRERNQ